jgi:diguanylate cyclase (GGDEF)-like protein
MRWKSKSSFDMLAVGVGLVALFVFATLGVVRMTDWSVESALMRSAETEVSSWAARLADRSRTLPAEGEVETDSDLSAAQREGSLASYRVWDAEGRLRLASPGAPLNPMTSRDTQRLSSPGETAVDIRRIHSGDGVRVLVEARAPIVSAGRTIGYVEVQADQTRTRGMMQAVLPAVVTGLIGMGLVAFGIPLVALVRRTREKKEADERIRYLSGHDPMTGLLNRPRFSEELDGKLAEDRAPEKASIFYVDLERVQTINDLFGHQSGDAVIREVAADIAGVAGRDALVARLGGDEFAVARFDVPDRDAASSFAQTLLDVAAKPRIIGADALALAATVGVSVGPTDGADAQSLMKSAHLALSHAKSASVGTFRFFDPGMDQQVRLRREIEERVRDAVARDAFDLHFQPVYRTQGERLVGFEALLRLPAGEGALISPALFVPVAEELGLISKIGGWVIRRACAVAACWPEDVSVAVNLSPAQFKDGEVSRVVREALAQSGLAPHRLELEITEGLLMIDTEAVLSELAALKAIGVSIVMDDFGTGYSSLSYLWKFPFDKIKIDRAFMRAYEARDAQIGTILEAIMSLSRSLRLRVTAEGVETEAQAVFLRRLDCDEVQGFLFGKPMPTTEVAGVLMREARRRIEPDSVPLERAAG